MLLVLIFQLYIIEELYSIFLFSSFSNELAIASNHLQCLVDYDDSCVIGSVTYKEMREIIDRVYDSNKLKEISELVEENLKKTAEENAATAQATAQTGEHKNKIIIIHIRS